ncbi:MAG: hypothetical protein AAF744_08315 [Pseudomonadota bacterium]
MTGALLRAVLVALLIATPALMLPGVGAESSQITILVGMLAAFLTFIEYNSHSPSIVGFRDAPPFNRLRFCALFLTVALLSAIMRGQVEPTLYTRALASIGTIFGNAIDFPFSPVRLMVLMLPEDTPQYAVDLTRKAAGLAYLLSLITIAIFLVIVRVLNWPARKGAFNVWVNLPLFDPTAGGDVIYRLQRDARMNMALGFVLPFLVPAVVKLGNDLVNPVSMQNPQTLIWMMSAWAFIPASMMMRGIAMAKVADMIEDKRRRAYADAEAEAVLRHA